MTAVAIGSATMRTKEGEILVPVRAPPSDDESTGVGRAGVCFDQNVSDKLDLEDLFRTHHALVFRAAYRVTGSLTDAEDVLQTIFMRLAHRGRREQGAAELGENPEAYLYRAAVNAGLDVVRARTRSPQASDDDARALASHDANADPEARRASGELRDAVRDALARMNNRAGVAFALRYFEGFDNKQIAEMFDTSPLVVGVMLHRARQALRKELKRFAGEVK